MEEVTLPIITVVHAPQCRVQELWLQTDLHLLSITIMRGDKVLQTIAATRGTTLPTRPVHAVHSGMVQTPDGTTQILVQEAGVILQATGVVVEECAVVASLVEVASAEVVVVM